MKALLRGTVVAASVALSASAALAAGGASSVALTPLCITKAGSALFFMEQSDDCGGADRRCRGGRWAYAALGVGRGWEFEPLGECATDEEASPEANALAARQAFKAPAAHVCATFLRTALIREPDLPDSDAYFTYSIERGAVILRWNDQKTTLAGEVRLSRATWCARGCEAGREGPRAEAKALDAGFTLLEGRGAKKATAVLAPVMNLTVGGDVLLGFPEPVQDSKDRAYLVLQVPEKVLREAQARLLAEDARRQLDKGGGDLLGESRATGLLDAALQLGPTATEVRFDYARALARRGDVASTVRELEKLRTSKDLRAKIDSDKAFVGLKAKEPFKKFVDGLPK